MHTWARDMSRLEYLPAIPQSFPSPVVGLSLPLRGAVMVVVTCSV